MTAGEYAGLVAATLSSAGLILAGLRWIVKSYLHELVPKAASAKQAILDRLGLSADELRVVLG